MGGFFGVETWNSLGQIVENIITKHVLYPASLLLIQQLVGLLSLRIFHLRHLSNASLLGADAAQDDE